MTSSAATNVLSRHVAAAAGPFFDSDDHDASPGLSGNASSKDVGAGAGSKDLRQWSFGRTTGNASSKDVGAGAGSKDLRQWSFGSHRASEESRTGRPDPPPLRRSHSNSDLLAAAADHGSLYITDPGIQRRRASATERLLSELSKVRPPRERRDSVMSAAGSKAVASRELRERDDCMYVTRDGSQIVAKARI